MPCHRLPEVGAGQGLLEPGGAASLEVGRGVLSLRGEQVIHRTGHSAPGGLLGQELAWGEPVLGDHTSLTERLAKELPGELSKQGDAVTRTITKGGRGANRAGEALGGADLGPQAPDEAGHIPSLCAVVSVQLVQHQIAQGFRSVLGPEPLVLLAQEQHVEHAVVGE